MVGLDEETRKSGPKVLKDESETFPFWFSSAYKPTDLRDSSQLWKLSHGSRLCSSLEVKTTNIARCPSQFRSCGVALKTSCKLPKMPRRVVFKAYSELSASAKSWGLHLPSAWERFFFPTIPTLVLLQKYMLSYCGCFVTIFNKMSQI